jgi:DNA-binding LacI/PurR family transcriptional regulator
VIGGPAGVLCGRPRIDGYWAALDATGLPFGGGLVREGTFRHAGGYDTACALLALPHRPTAVLAGREPDAYHVELATALVRSSTAPPRSRR